MTDREKIYKEFDEKIMYKYIYMSNKHEINVGK